MSICSSAKKTAQLVGEAFFLRCVEQLQVKGKSQPVEVRTVLAERSQAGEPPEWLALADNGVRLYRQRDFARAAELFASAARLWPDDPPLEEYLRRAQNYAAHPPGPEWSAVQILNAK